MSESAAGKNGDHAAAEEPSCIDGLLWIGQTYPEFFCGRPKNCVKPEKPKGPHCFVHEADERGISRRIAQIPSWAVPGESRIFLAHRGGEREPWRGRIFGYFTLDRIEVIYDPFTGPGPHKDEPVKPSDEGEPSHKGPRKGKPQTGGRKSHKHGADEEPDEPDEPEEPEDEDKRKDHRSRGGRSKDGRVVFLRTDDEGLAEHRGCSRRNFAGAVYLVDRLEAEITDAFAARLNRGSIRRSIDKQAAKELFKQALDSILPRHASRAHVPPSLRGKAHARGELVLFDDPPLFEQRPQASFRALAHIDGEHLIDQIARGEAKAEIHHCRKRVKATTPEVVTMVAERAHANRAFARELLTALSGVAREELTEHDEFHVPGMGTLKQDENGGVRFLPYRALEQKAK